MQFLIQKILKTVGWQKLLSYAYSACRPQLAAFVKKTDNKLDDVALAVLDEIMGVIGAAELAEAPAKTSAKKVA